MTAFSIALFSAALTQPAFFVGASPASAGPAWRMLLDGWRAVPHGYIEWCANPVLFLSWSTLPTLRPRVSLAAACASVALMLMFLFRRTLALPGTGTTLTITSHGTGYWLWLGSALLMVVAAARTIRR